MNAYKIVLHTCCAPCSAAVIEYFLNAGVEPVLYYFNPNIYPEEEYLIRKAECTRYAQSVGVEIIDEDYNHTEWLERIKGFENEPERGKRCLHCFKMRLFETARIAYERNIRFFATTLASSRWKNVEQIAEAGHWAASLLGDLIFIDDNWRKGGLSERRRILLAENNFYNQTWCGCEFSRRPPKDK